MIRPLTALSVCLALIGCSSADGPTDDPVDGALEETAGETTGDGAATSPDGALVDATSDGGTDLGTPPTDVGVDTPPAPTKGCGLAATTGWQCEKLTVAGVARDYCFYVPPTYDSKKPIGLVFQFHGCGGGISEAKDYEAYGAGRYVFVYPKSAASCWSPGGPDSTFVVSIKESLAARLCVDDARVFASGFSSGGFMASALACSRTAGIRGSATAGGTTGCGTATPLWQYHGTKDTPVPFASYGPPTRDQYVKVNGCSATTTAIAGSPCVEYAGCKQRTIWCSDEGGHRWPGSAWMNKGVLDFFATL